MWDGTNFSASCKPSVLPNTLTLAEFSAKEVKIHLNMDFTYIYT